MKTKYSKFRSQKSFRQVGKNRGRHSNRKIKSIDVRRYINKNIEDTEVVEKFTPKHSFNDFNIDQRLKHNIASRGFVTPTPIQDGIIPHIILGKDVVGMANTGTGKTAAFLIPLISETLLNQKQTSIIVVPTRELATQINDELRAFVKNLPIYSVVCVGGSPYGSQIRQLNKKPHFIIGTPGRLKDFIERKIIKIDQITRVVLDEADRMLDMGFVNDMKYLIHQMPKEKQGLFFSATMSKTIESIIKDFLQDPVTVSVKKGDISKNIFQDVVKISRNNKFEKLCELLRDSEFTKVLVFGTMKHSVEKLSKDLREKGFRADAIHGNKKQGARQRILTSFKNKELQVLVATDVAARGLDIPDVSHVINYDIPQSDEDYIHRIGRTGRGDKRGIALTFVE